MADLPINTGPLIALSRMGATDVVGELPYAFVAPERVREELDEGERLGHPRVAPSWLRIEPLRSRPPPLLLTTVDAGEAAVIQLACERGLQWVCIDEWKGRRTAIASGLKVVGVLGLLAKCKQSGIIEVARPYIERAREAGIHYHDALVREVLQAIGE